jgi:diacylglycerol kinase family enzyme
MWADPVGDALAGPGASAAGPELFVVLNPGSGAHDADATRATLAAIFSAGGRRHRFVPVARPAELVEAATRAAREAREAGAVLVAVGGDGTLNAVAQAAWQADCLLGVLPQGTFNLFGRNLGIAQDLETAARALLRAEPAPVQVGEVNGRLFLVNASLGLYPQLLQDREAFKQQLGRHRWVALLSGLKTLFVWRRQLALEFELDGERQVVTTPTLFVGNNRLQFEQLGVDPALAARVGEGCLLALVVRPVGLWRLLGLALRGALGQLGEADAVHCFAFRSLQVRVLGMRKLKLAADGEVGVQRPPLRFAVAARPLQLLLPRPEDRVPVA